MNMVLPEFKKDVRYKYIDWSSVINIVCLVISIILLVILIVYDVKKLVINNILANIAYSFIAGYIFYLLMNFIPDKIKNKKAKALLYQRFDLIYTVVFATKIFSDKLADCHSKILSNTDGDNTQNYDEAHKCLSKIMASYMSIKDIIDDLEKYILFMNYPQVQKLLAIKNHYVYLVSESAINGGNIKQFEEIFQNYQHLLDMAENLRKSAI